MVEPNKREVLKRLYRSAKWARKVDGWSDDQVTAVYLRLKSQGKIS
jgi:hypothetical protein